MSVPRWFSTHSSSDLIAGSVLLLLGLSLPWHPFRHLLGLDAPQEAALIILLITAVLWISELISLYVTSFLVLLLSILWLVPLLESAGLPAGKEPFFFAFFSDLTLLFMGGFVLSALLNKYGLARLIANWMLRQTGGKPSRVLLGIIGVASLLSMWMSNTATAAMMFAVVAPILSGLPETSPFAKGMALAIPFACNLGGLGTPIGTPPNAIALEYLNRMGVDLSFVEWMLMACPVMLLLLFLLWRTLLWLFPPGDLEVAIERQETDKLSRRQYLVLAIFLVTVGAWMTGGLTGLSTGTVGLLVVIVCFGSNLLSTRDFRNISWEILFMLGGGLCLGVALQSSGLTARIAVELPMDQGFWWIFGLLVLLAALMTTFMSNTATANLLVPIAVSLPHNQLLLAVAISIMCSGAMALPVNTPPNAVAFGSGLLRSVDMFRAGLWITLFALAATLLAGVFYLPLFH